MSHYNTYTGNLKLNVEVALRLLDLESPITNTEKINFNRLCVWYTTPQGSHFWRSLSEKTCNGRNYNIDEIDCPEVLDALRADPKVRTEIIKLLEIAGVSYKEPLKFIPPTSNQGVYSQGCQSKC